MKKLYIDVSKLLEADTDVSDIECSYFYHRNNDGPLSLLEVVEFAVYCRKCTEAFCVEACPKDALELTDTGMVKRHNMRCVGCKTCILACPFGTIFPEVMNYLTSKCDYCLGKMEEDASFVPKCVDTSPAGTIELRELDKEVPEENIFFYGDHVAINSHHWLQKEKKV